MIRTIWKYPLELTEEQMIVMPRGATPVLVATQMVGGGDYSHPVEQLCLWMLVDTEQPEDSRLVGVFGTGHEIPLNARHAGSTVMGEFVWHVFINTERSG